MNVEGIGAFGATCITPAQICGGLSPPPCLESHQSGLVAAQTSTVDILLVHKLTQAESVCNLQREQKPQRMGGMQRPHPHGPSTGQASLRLQSSGPFTAHGGDRQPQGNEKQLQSQQSAGLSNFQQHQIQQAYNNLMQQKQQLSVDEVPPSQASESIYPLQPVPSRVGPNNMLTLPSYRILPTLTSNDLDTIMKLRQQLSGENGLLTRLSSFMQAQRTTDQHPLPGIYPTH